jgi:uncharacterized membrane protein HdeD (DUF308 family)
MNEMNFSSWIYSGLTGLLAIVFGLVALLFPSITLVALAIYFGISLLIGGLLLSIGAFRLRKRAFPWGLVLFEGLLGLLCGLFILLRPEISVSVLVIIVGIWALFLGGFFLLTYWRRKDLGFSNNYFLVAGIFSVLFGLLILAKPLESSRLMVVLIGIYSIIYGITSMLIHRRRNIRGTT